MVKNKGGRPTKYKAEYCAGIIDYFNLPPQQTVYKKTYYANGTLKSEEPVVLAEQLPTFQGFADSVGVHIDTLHQWCKDYAEFSEAYARAKQLQEKIWLVNGMGGQYNSQFAQFFGKNCLGYKDKQEISAEVKSENINADVPDDEKVEFIKRVAKKLENNSQ